MGELKDLLIKALKADTHIGVCGFIRDCKLPFRDCEGCSLAEDGSIEKLIAELEES